MTWRVSTARGWVVGSKSQQAWEQQVEGTATLPDAETMFRETLPRHRSWEDAGLLEKILLHLTGWLRMAVAQYPCSSLGYQPLRLAELCSLGLQEELFTWRNLDKKYCHKTIHLKTLWGLCGCHASPEPTIGTAFHSAETSGEKMPALWKVGCQGSAKLQEFGRMPCSRGGNTSSIMTF